MSRAPSSPARQRAEQEAQSNGQGESEQEKAQHGGTHQGRLLLDGFKRYRCAAKLCIECVPYISLAGEETQGIAALVEARQQKGLSILEQTRDFHAQANLLVASLLSRRESFFKKMEEFYDRSGQA